jgi:hypothetical protein
MRLSRRRMLELSLGATQVGLLGSLLGKKARAQTGARPTKLLCLWLNGGCHFETFFAPFSTAGINKFIPTPSGGLIPWGYNAAQVQRFDGMSHDVDAPGPRRPLAGPIYFDRANPAATTGAVPGSDGAQQFRPYGYAWADPNHRLYDQTCVLIGADQNTASHQSGIVASMCGVAGASFRAPAVQAVVAAAMAERFPGRPIPSATLGGITPAALGLPSLSQATRMTNEAAVLPTLSTRRDSAWLGLRNRSDVPSIDVRGVASAGTVPLTPMDAHVLDATRRLMGASSIGTDALLESFYETTKGASKAIARDVLTTLEGVRGFEHLQNDPLYGDDWTACIGYADVCGPGNRSVDYEFALRLLKSDLVTSVTLPVTSISNFSFDTHIAGGVQIHTNHLRIAMEAVGRLLLEMQLTPSSDGGGRTLLDETLVYIYSDFGRTFPKQGSDHHPATCAILAGGGIVGNQMIGGYDEAMNGSPMGAPVNILEEDGSAGIRAPRSQDVVATVLSAFGLEMGTDFFIPGGYGVFDGVVRT